MQARCTRGRSRLNDGVQQLHKADLTRADKGTL